MDLLTFQKIRRPIVYYYRPAELGLCAFQNEENVYCFSVFQATGVRGERRDVQAASRSAVFRSGSSVTARPTVKVEPMKTRATAVSLLRVLSK